MDSTKKSASDTVNEYKRVALRFFKETNLLRYWMEYIETEKYKYFVNMYLRKNECSNMWYDRYCCMDILGMCNFEVFLEGKQLKDTHAYKMFSCYLALFWEDELRKWINKSPSSLSRYQNYLNNPDSYIEDALNGVCLDWDRLTNTEKKKILEWKKLKENGVYRRF